MAAGRTEFLNGEMERIFLKVFIHVKQVMSVEFGTLGLLLVISAVEGGEHEFLDGVHELRKGKMYYNWP